MSFCINPFRQFTENLNQKPRLRIAGGLNARAPLKTVLFRDCGVSLVLLAFGGYKLGVLRAVRPQVSVHTLRFCARNFLGLTKKS